MYSLPIIGSIFINPKCLGSVIEHIRPAMLDSANARKTLQAMIMMDIAGEPIDLTTVASKVCGQNGVDPVWLTKCLEETATAVNAPYYAKQQYEYWAKRELKTMCGNLTFDGSLSDTLGDMAGILSDFEQNYTAKKRAGAEAGTITEDYLQWISGIKSGKIKTIKCHTPGLVDPYDAYKSIIPFWMGGLYMVISAYSTVGKSAYLATLAACEAEAGANVIIFSNEMGRLGYATRFAAYYSNIPYGHILQNKLDGHQEKPIDDALIRYSTMPIWTYERVRSIKEVKAILKKLSYSMKPDIILIDYLQNMVDKSQEVKSQTDRASQELMHIAQDFDCSVVAASQVDNSTARNPDQNQNFMAVKGSGDVSADAVIFMELTRDTLNYDKDKQRIITRTVKKNRDFGRVGKKEIYFNKSFSRITNEIED